MVTETRDGPAALAPVDFPNFAQKISRIKLRHPSEDVLHERVLRRVGVNDGLLDGDESDFVALEGCLGRERFQAVTRKAVELVDNDRIEGMALRSSIAQHLLKRIANPLIPGEISGVELCPESVCDAMPLTNGMQHYNMNFLRGNGPQKLPKTSCVCILYRRFANYGQFGKIIDFIPCNLHAARDKR